MLNRSGKSEHSCVLIYPDLQEKKFLFFFFFNIECDVKCELVIYDVIMLKCASSMPGLSSVFIIKECLILSIAFPASVEMIM